MKGFWVPASSWETCPDPNSFSSGWRATRTQTPFLSKFDMRRLGRPHRQMSNRVSVVILDVSASGTPTPDDNETNPTTEGRHGCKRQTLNPAWENETFASPTQAGDTRIHLLRLHSRQIHSAGFFHKKSMYSYVHADLRINSSANTFMSATSMP